MSQHPLAVGDTAPDFTLRDQNGAAVTRGAVAGGRAGRLGF